MKKYNDLISVIIPIYNVEEYLDKCVSSVVNQSYKNLEIILVDDGSIDKCPQKCDEWLKKDNRIKVVHKKNGGISEARNVGIEQSIGKYIYFIDSDDYIDINMIEELYKNIKKENSDICAGGFVYEKGDYQKSYYCDKLYVEDSEKILKRFLCDNDFSTCIWDKLYKKKLFQEIKFPVGKIHEDMGTLYKLISKSKIISHIPLAGYHYVQREGSIINSKFDSKQLNLVYFKEEIMNFIIINYPNILEYAERFYMQQLNKSIVQCYKNGLKKEYKELKNKLNMYIRKFLNNKKISFRTKIKSIIILSGGSILLKK